MKVDFDLMARAAEKNEGWYNKCSRYGNLTWVETDPVNYDIDWWIDFCKRTYTDVVTLSVGGIVAFYPTKIPYHHKAIWLGDRDMVGEFVTRCRQEGIYVIARIDPHAFRDDMAQAHPEWIFTRQDGEKRRHWDNKDLWVACTHGGYTYEYLTDVIREIMTLYMPDAVFSNRYEGSGICYCDSCRREFREASGFELPSEDNVDLGDPVRAAYERWNEKKLFDRWAFWDAEVKRINPNAIFSPNVGGGTMRMMDLKRLGARAERINIDRQGRRAALDPMWSLGREGRIFSSVFKGKPIAGGYSVGPEWRYRWKDATQAQAELRMFYAVGLASGMRPSWGKFSGKLYDRRWVKPIEEMFDWHHQNHTYFLNKRSLAKAAILHTQLRAWQMDGKTEKDFTNDHELGMYQAFVEARIPIDMIHSAVLDEETLSRYSLLVLPNTTHLDEGQCALIRKFVRDGGQLVATYESSLYAGDGARRDNFALADVFGADYVATKDGPIINSYISIDADAGGNYHPIVRGLEDATRIIGGVWQLEVTPNARQDSPPLTLVPSYPSLPMEDCYPRQEHTDIPWVYINRYGKGRSVYFPWDIDRTFWETLDFDNLRVLRNTFHWLLAEDRPVAIEGEGMLEVAVWEQERSMTVHVLNYTNPMFWKGPYRELLPLRGQRIEIRLPEGRTAGRVRCLVSGAEIPDCTGQAIVTFDLPPIADHEVIAIDY